MRRIAALAAALVLAGCGSGDSDGIDEDDAAAKEAAAVECASSTLRTRTSIDALLATVLEGSFTEAEHDAQYEQFTDELSAMEIEGCGENATNAITSAVDNVKEAAAIFQACERPKCLQDVANEASVPWGEARRVLVTFRTGVGTDAIQAALNSFEPTPLDAAVEQCMDSLGEDANAAAIAYMQLRDQGNSLILRRPDDFFANDDSEVVGCVLGVLDAPASTIALLESTTAMMGRQTDTWEDIEASWSYHPDDGIDMILESIS